MSVKNIGKGRWKIIVTDRLNGKPIKKEATITGTKLKANEKELELKNILQSRIDEHNRSLTNLKRQELRTFGECIGLYEQSGKVWKEAYVKRLREHLNHSILTDSITEKSIWDDLKSFQEYMLNVATQKTGEPFSVATVNRHIAIAKKIVSAAYCEHRVIRRNYLAGFPTIPEHNKTYRTLSNNERGELFKYLPEWLKPFVYTAMRIPTRINELVNLTVDQIDYGRKLFILEDGTTKNNEGRWLPIFPELEAYVLSIPQEQKYVFSKVLGENAPIGYFSAKESKYLFNDYSIWNKACSDAGIKGYNFHKTRQQSAMQMLYDGFSELETMMIGGWKTVEAFRRYVRADAVMLQKKMGRWEEDDSWKQDLAPKPF